MEEERQVAQAHQQAALRNDVGDGGCSALHGRGVDADVAAEVRVDQVRQRPPRPPATLQPLRSLHKAIS